MKFKLEHDFNWPADKITDILKRGEDIIPMEDLPNVSQRKRVEQRREGDKLYSKLEWCVHGQIPKIAQKVIRPETLTFIEQTIWDDNTCMFTTRIIPHFFKDKLVCRSTSQWLPIGENKCRRTFQGNIEVKFPLFGKIMEKTIVDYMRKNNDENAVMVRKALEKRFGPPSE